MGKTVLEAWTQYRDNVLKQFSASPEQIEASRRIFYMGALCSFTLLANLLMNSTGDTDKAEKVAQGVAGVKAINRELQVYFNEVYGPEAAK